jgi:predicted nucleotidyltransferase
MKARATSRNENRESPEATTQPPAEVREVADASIAALGNNLRALLWHGSWARGEQTAESDHDLIVVVRRIDNDILRQMHDVFEGRRLWSTYVKTEEELRQYPLTGRLQFHYGCVALHGEFEAPPVTRKGLVEELRRSAVDIQHECRYRLIHGSGGGQLYAGMDPAYQRLRVARWMYYQAKLSVLALKAREVLKGRPYPRTREELRTRLSDEDELAVVDIIDRWPELRPGFEEDVTPLALQLDTLMRKLVKELDQAEAQP